MADPQTTNKALIIPNTGADVGTWGSAALNPDFVAIDGMLGGVATVGLSNANVVLTAPGGVISPSAGPTQSQNAVLRFTGVLTANVKVTLPLPGFVIVENITTGAFVVTFAAASAGEVIATPQGSRMQIFNDGTNVRFMSDVSSFPGKMEFLGGAIAIPAWMTACTVKPFLLADGSTFLLATYPALASLYGTSFGGDGFTTSAVPDMQGRYPLAYGGATGRITTAGCGLDGTVLGAAGGLQNGVITKVNLPDYLLNIADNGHAHGPGGDGAQFIETKPVGGGPTNVSGAGNATTSGVTASATTGISVGLGGSSTPVPNVPPTQVAGIWLIKT